MKKKIKKWIIADTLSRQYWSDITGWGSRKGATKYSTTTKKITAYLPGQKSKWVVY